MASKKSTPVKVERNEKGDFNSQHGMLYAYFVEMQNGDKGVYKCKDVNNPKFVIGKEIEYDVEVKEGVSSSGMDYKITTLKPASNGGNGNYKKKEVTKEEAIAYVNEKVYTASAELEKCFAISRSKLTPEHQEYFKKQRSIWTTTLQNAIIRDDKVVGYTKMKASFDAFRITTDFLIARSISDSNISLFDGFVTMFNQFLNVLIPKVNEQTSNNN